MAAESDGRLALRFSVRQVLGLVVGRFLRVVEVSRHTDIRTVGGHDGARVECSPRRGVTAVEPVDRLFLGTRVGTAVAADVIERREQVGVHDREINGTRATHGPADDAPVRWVRRRAESRDDIWADVFD
jgi:hypothetical protein